MLCQKCKLFFNLTLKQYINKIDLKVLIALWTFTFLFKRLNNKNSLTVVKRFVKCEKI